jgi:hypothetical protein
MKLNLAQAAHVARVRAADFAWRNARFGAAARAKIVAEKEVAGFLAARDLEVRLAFEAGVPKSQIGKDGLSTTSPVTLEESLARTEKVIL